MICAMNGDKKKMFTITRKNERKYFVLLLLSSFFLFLVVVFFGRPSAFADDGHVIHHLLVSKAEHNNNNNNNNNDNNNEKMSISRMSRSLLQSVITRSSSSSTNATKVIAQKYRINQSNKRAIRTSAQAQQAGAQYTSKKEGEFPSLEFRVFYEQNGKKISPWHDVPLKSAANDGSYNFICEIPKETKAKMEVATDEKLTPIKQDTKKGKLRDYPYNINWNYGMLPQTWEDPGHVHPEMNVKGDNDPVDVVEIGSKKLEMGSVTAVKALGVYAMIDEGELDWKVICISTSDPKASQINDVADVEKHMPGELEKIRVWFRDYKTPDGKPQNMFGLNDKCMPATYAKDVIEETNGFYKALKSGKRVNDVELSLE
jgi:inorganic pyrophosphatase